jgi:hypothetical protein
MSMDVILLVITVVSLIVAFVMSVTAARLMRSEKERSAARVAALSLAASEPAVDLPLEAPAVRPIAKAPWSAPKIADVASASARQESREPRRDLAEAAFGREGGPATHASGFLGATELPRENGGRQKSLAFAAVVLFLVLSGGLVWVMSEPRGTTAAAMGPNAPLELVSLTHQRQDQKLAVSGLVRNPVAGQPVERLSAVVFLFDRVGTFITSSKANVDFLKLGAGDETPFVVSLDAPATVARYRVSFRTDDGVVPHIDRRDTPAPAGSEQAVSVSVK